jgi:hypothetical protein
VSDAGALDAGVEVVAHFALIARIELPAQEGGDVLGTDEVNGAADQVIVKGSQVVATLEDDVGGVLDLHDAPVIAGRERGGRRAELANEVVELAVQRGGFQPDRDPLGEREVIDADEGVVHELIANPEPLQARGQPVVAVEAEVEAERSPGGYAQVAQAQVRVDEVEVVVEAFAAVSRRNVFLERLSYLGSKAVQVSMALKMCTSPGWVPRSARIACTRSSFRKALMRRMYSISSPFSWAKCSACWRMSSRIGWAKAVL